MILVVGGTGRLGRQLVTDLLTAGERVRVLARGVQPFPAGWPDAVERMAGDLNSSADCRHAVIGCEKLAFAASGFGLARNGDPRSVDRDGAIRIIEAATAAEVQQVVMVSMHGAAADAPIELLRCKHAAEEAARNSGMGWTIIRLGVLLDQWVDMLSASLEAKGKVAVFGAGTAPVTFTSVVDAAAIARRALSDPALQGRVLEWGSEELALRQLADQLIATAGHGTVQAVPRVALRIMALSAKPFSPFLARMAEAGILMDSGAMRFDLARTRSEFPDIPVRGIRDAVPSPTR